MEATRQEQVRRNVRPLSTICTQVSAREREKVARTGGTWASKFGKKIISWDVAPKQEYFDELFRISRNQIIWGGNYFNLPSTRCFLIWRKTNVPENFSMAMCEYAWASFNDNAKMFEFSAVGQPGRFHPTQKPIELYEWILRNYAHEGDKILDTHVGSASSLIACQRLGFDFVGFEIDSTYYQLASERFERETAQMTLTNYLKGLKST
jgi:site-specific DNA-methyltransferase (adenine-specific)